MIVAGLMSGTSMDGIDVALADLRLAGGELVLRPLGHHSVAYGGELRCDLAGALPPAATTLAEVCRLDTLVGREFAAAVAGPAARAGAELVVSHGQTLYHWVEPDGRVAGTLQIGQPAWIAAHTGLPVVSDLRAADVAAGGQGAPLVSLFDVLLLAGTGVGDGEAAVALNLGGIANVTIVGPGADPVAFDVGPANALLDAAAARLSGGRETCDRDGRGAAAGRVDAALAAALAADPYYRRPPPKTTGKEHFHAAYLDAVLDRVPPVSGEDLLATLTVHTAAVVADACAAAGAGGGVVVASGGGTANPVLMEALAARLGPGRLRRIDDLGLPSEAKEAYAFCVLGFLTVHGLPGTIPSCTGARRATVLGRLTPGAGPLRLPPTPPAAPTRLVVEG